MKKGWGRYATEKRYIQKGYLRKHCDGSSGRKAYQASRCDCVQQSGQKEEIERSIEWYGKVVQLTEEPIVYKGDENERNSGTSRSRERDRVEEDNSGSVRPLQDVSRIKPKRSRKARNTKTDA